MRSIFLDGHRVGRPVVELRRLRRRVPRDLLGVLKRPAVSTDTPCFLSPETCGQHVDGGSSAAAARRLINRQDHPPPAAPVPSAGAAALRFWPGCGKAEVSALCWAEHRRRDRWRRGADHRPPEQDESGGRDRGRDDGSSGRVLVSRFVDPAGGCSCGAVMPSVAPATGGGGSAVIRCVRRREAGCVRSGPGPLMPGGRQLVFQFPGRASRWSDRRAPAR